VTEAVVNIRIWTVFFICLFGAGNAIAGEYHSEYFRLGEWTLGAKAKDILGGAVFQEITEVTKNEEYTARVKNVFADATPITLYFKRGKLERTRLTVYEGRDFEKSRQSMRDILRIFESQYGGANLEGLTTQEGLEPEMIDLVIGQLFEKTGSTLRGMNEEAKREKQDAPETFFSLFIGMTTERRAEKNALYAKFSYHGATETYNVTVYEDKKFNEAHIAPAMIHLDSRAPAPESTQ
jgi:hypothetical protein